MGNVTVYFVGVCTHLMERTSEETDHRVVVLKVAPNGEDINHHWIEPHIPELFLKEGQPPILLEGVHLELNAASSGVTYADEFHSCIPNTRELTPHLPPLSEEVVRRRRPELVAAYFDAAGDFTAYVDTEGASYAVLNVETVGLPELTITSFTDGTSETRTLEDGAKLQISNLGRTSNDDRDHDFLIHYKIAQSIPQNARWPEERKACEVVPPPYPHNTVGPGCSNSNYP